MGENGYDNFGTVLRKVQVNLTYTHSSTLKSTFHQDTMAYVYVNSDAYDANVRVTELQWTYFEDNFKRGTTYSFDNKNKETSNNRSLPGIFDSTGGDIGSSSTARFITYGLKDFTDNTRGKQPDESKMVEYAFKPNNTQNNRKAGVRDISGMEICVVENTFGPDMPIAEVSFDNYIKDNGQFGATAEIIPLFKKSTDYNEWRMDRTYSKSTNAATNVSPNVADYLDLTDNAEETFLPANTNYGVYLNAEGNKAYLYRKEPVNYEDWTKKYGISTDNRELVAVSIRYEAPNDVEGRINASLDFENHKTIMFAVQHTDAPEIKWSDNFTFNVDEGDSSVDITSILSATLHGDPDCIDYYVAGWIDDSGCVYFHENDPSGLRFAGYEAILSNSDGTSTKSFYDLSENFDQSMIKPFDGRSKDTRTNTSTGAIAGDNYKGDTADGSVTDLVLNPTDPRDIVHSDYQDDDLEDYTVDGKLIIYHKNHATKATGTDTNNKFDAYVKKSHKLLVVAKVDTVVATNVERKMALININVREASTGFKIKANKSSIINTVETLGTVAEGLSEAANNPEFSIKQKIIDAITHEDLTTSQLNDGKTVKYSISYIDPDLAVCPPSGSDGEEVPFSEKVIKLKDIPANKTTETSTGPSEKLAYHNHYNYERKSEYQVHVCAEFNNYEEIKVKQVDNYICGEYKVANQQDVFNGANKKAKTADFIMLDETVDGIKQTRPTANLDGNSSKFYYFKHPSTGKYVGPLSTTPYAIEDLTATKEVNGVKAKYAYVRYEAKDSLSLSSAGKNNMDFTPLYKAPGFSDRMAKAPKPTDTCLLIFTIKVLNTFDKARTLPQAYTTTGNKPFKFSDPTEGLLTDSDTVTVEEGAKHIAYVYADHSELNTNGGKDHEDTALIPAWHPHFKSEDDVEYNEWTMGGKTYKKNKLGAGTVRKSHPKATVETMNIKPEVGITTNGHANNSVRYGRFRDSNTKGGVFLDFFVEHHGEIDCSGHNEHSDEILFGQAIDYSGTVGKFVYSDNHDPMRFGLQREANSDRRLYRLNCMVRHAQHFNTDLSDSFYAKGQIAFNECNRAEFGKIYKFSVAAVSNKLATAHDLSYNKNMVDWNRSFYPYIKDHSVDQISGSNNKVDMPQPFQKYVYDPSGERVVTMGYALENMGPLNPSELHDGPNPHDFVEHVGDKSIDASGLNGAIIRPYLAAGEMKLDHYYSGSALPNADSSGALFTTRTHFTVVVTKGGCDIVTSDKLSENTGKMVFNSKQIVKNVTVGSDGVVSGVPSDVSAKDGEIRIMQDADGNKHMAYYNANSKSWTTI
jgi:hypothetical protein